MSFTSTIFGKYFLVVIGVHEEVTNKVLFCVCKSQVNWGGENLEYWISANLMRGSG